MHYVYGKMLNKQPVYKHTSKTQQEYKLCTPHQLKWEWYWKGFVSIAKKSKKKKIRGGLFVDFCGRTQTKASP